MRFKLFVYVIFISIVLIVTSLSCSSQFRNKSIQDVSRNNLIQNKVLSIISRKVGLDTLGNSIWERVDGIEYYNNVGLKIMTLIPKYFPGPEIKTPPGGLSLEQLSNFRASESNVPTGIVDTTFYEYDKNENLSMIRNEFLTQIKYDQYDNWVEKCFSSKFREDMCNYRIYEYDGNGKIIYHLDSAGARSKKYGDIDKWKFEKVFYKYDSKGNILYDGASRKFNGNGQLVEVKYSEGEKKEFQYDAEGKLSCEILTLGSRASKTLFYYYPNKLLKQRKHLSSKNELTELINYEYSFFQ